VVNVVVKLKTGCSTRQLTVSGHGVKVSDAKRLQRQRCRVTLNVAAGARGHRDLSVRRGKRTTRIAVIRL
jgi:hypothetical protein